jgi:hypothetical protein
MVQRMTGAQRVSANELSKEMGVGQPTLSRWLKEAGTFASVASKTKNEESVPRRPDDWSPQEKMQAVMESAAVSDSELGVWLRSKGLTEEHLRQWREVMVERANAVFAPQPPRMPPAERRRVEALEKELRRKEKALAETAALLVLQGKMQALWAEEDDATRPSSDDSSSTPSPKPRNRERD